jgi:hypothetical protein
MATMWTSTFTKETLEEYIDQIKVIVVGGLVKSELVDKDKADEWCENHTLLLRRKSFFRTLSDKWKKDKSDSSHDYVIVVKKNI